MHGSCSPPSAPRATRSWAAAVKPACHQTAQDDIELLPRHDGLRQVDREQPREVLAGPGGARDVGDAARDLTLNRIGVGGGKQMA